MILEKCRKSAVYNLGTGKSTSIQEVAKAVYEEFGLSLKPVTKTKKVTVDFWADISKIKEDIGWKPKFYIEDGIQNILSSKTSNG